MRNAPHRWTTSAAPALLALAAIWTPGSPAGLGPQPLLAQGPAQGTGRITGTVTGTGGQPVAGAQVSIPATRAGAVTGDDGRFTIANGAPGTYTVRVQRIANRGECADPRNQQPVSLGRDLAIAVVVADKCGIAHRARLLRR